MASLQSIVYRSKDRLNDSERKIIRFTLNNASMCANLSLTQMAKKLYVSESAIFRLCKKLGLSGFSEFRFYLSNLADSQTTNNSTTAIDDFVINLTKANAEEVRRFREMNLDSLYQTLERAQKIYIYSTGWEQEMIANYLAHELFMIGKQATVLPSAFDELSMANVFSKNNDVLFIISFSGDNSKINDKIASLELTNGKFKYVSFTNMKQNKLAYIADYNFYYPTIKFADNPSFPNGAVAFAPAYLLVDLLISAYFSWFKERAKEVGK